jgi:hypothetical protein
MPRARWAVELDSELMGACSDELGRGLRSSSAGDGPDRLVEPAIGLVRGEVDKADRPLPVLDEHEGVEGSHDVAFGVVREQHQNAVSARIANR